MRAMYPDLSGVDRPMPIDLKPLIEEEAIYAKMAVRLKSVTAVLVKKSQEEQVAASPNDDGGDASSGMEGWISYKLWAKTHLMKLESKIRSIRDVDMANIMQKYS